MLKSSAGGGGIGMHLVEHESELAAALDGVERLAQKNFGRGGVFLERYVEQARHIEVQIFGDGAGDVIALGERDCSVQRRNQKVIEETPAAGLSAALRHRLHDTAIRLGRAVRYRSAGTVEFVYDVARGEFFFLEVNTRLQVEHCVTEAVTGIDLVEWMVRLAANDGFQLGGALIVRAHRSRCGSTPKTPHAAFGPRPARSPMPDLRPKHASIHGSRTGRSSRRITIHCSPRSSSRTRIATRPSRSCGAS